MNISGYLLLLLLMVVLISQALTLAAPTTSRPDVDDDFEDSDSEQSEDSDDDDLPDINQEHIRILFSDGFYSRNELKSTLLRLVDMIDHKKAPEGRRHDYHKDSAKALGRLMTNDDSFGSTDEDETDDELIDNNTNDPDYCGAITLPGKRTLTPKTLRDIVHLRDVRNRTHEAIKKRYPWYRPNYLPRIRNCLASNGTRLTKMSRVNEFVMSKVNETRRAHRPLHDFMIRRWGLQFADSIGIRPFFKGSLTWVKKFKKRNRIKSRAVTKYRSRAERDQQEQILDSIDQFLDEYEANDRFFSRRNILNTDQTGFNYEMSKKRTLSFVGERDTELDAGNQNRRTHSYTSQPTISRDGRTVGKLLLCMQEASGRFGPIIESRIRSLEQEYQNIVIVASKSGKMSKELINVWLRKVLFPAIIHNNLHNDPVADDETIDSDGVLEVQVNATQSDLDCYQNRLRNHSNDPERECFNRPHTMLLTDAWGGHSNREIDEELRSKGVKSLKIPKHTTAELQPLDVTIMRQYKKFFKRVADESRLPEYNYLEVTDRWGVINVHSLIWNQFGSEAYTDLIRYSWRNTDPSWSAEELSGRPKPRAVDEIQFQFPGESRCEHREKGREGMETCRNYAFIKCSHCGKLLCLHHFLERICFHERSESLRAGPSSGNIDLTVSDEAIENFLAVENELLERNVTLSSPHDELKN